MKTLLLDHDYYEAAAKLAGQFPDRSHANLTLYADTKVIAPDGEITAVLLADVIPRELHNAAFELWKSVRRSVGNRTTAVGTSALPRSKKIDGTSSPRSGAHARVMDVVEARQGILGFLGHPPRKAELTVLHSEMLSRSSRLIELLDELYAKHLPTSYAKQLEAVETLPQCRLGNTVFTTIYIAKNFRTAYHTDTGNLRRVMSALMPMGNFTGAELLFPRWRLAIAFKPGDLLLFDPQQLHGNLPFVGERLSAVFYCDRGIATWGSQKRRRPRIKRRRP